MGVHLDKCKPSVGLESSFDNITEVLEQRDEVVLSRVGRKITDVNSRLPLRCLLHNHVIALHTMGREMMVAIWSGRSHSHCGHGSLLRDGRLALLIGPVTANCTGAKPFTIHATQGLLGICALTESDKAVPTGTSSLHIPHDAGFRNRAKSREGLCQDFIVDLVGEITNKDVEMVSGILLAGLIGLIGPVDTDFLNVWFG